MKTPCRTEVLGPRVLLDGRGVDVGTGETLPLEDPGSFCVLQVGFHPRWTQRGVADSRRVSTSEGLRDRRDPRKDRQLHSTTLYFRLESRSHGRGGTSSQ